MIVGIGLLLLSHLIPQPQPPPSAAMPFPPMQPSPTWDTLPTRIPATPTPTPTPVIAAAAAPLAEFQAAMLRGELDAAQEAWETALSLAPHESVIWREGARLSLAQDNLLAAEARIRQAARLDARDALVWALWGELLLRQDAPEAAEQAYRMAEALDPTLARDLFFERWRAARRGAHIEQQAVLADAYARAYPDDPLADYYRASVMIAAGDFNGAIARLVAVLRDNPAAPGVLWYTLGEAYAARGAHHEAAQVFEVAASRLAQGDASLALASDNPLRDLNLRLARAYLDSGRCADAEAMLRRLTTTLPETAPWLRAAIICQTPTPTLTPWIIDPP